MGTRGEELSSALSGAGRPTDRFEVGVVLERLGDILPSPGAAMDCCSSVGGTVLPAAGASAPRSTRASGQSRPCARSTASSLLEALASSQLAASCPRFTFSWHRLVVTEPAIGELVVVRTRPPAMMAFWKDSRACVKA